VRGPELVRLLPEILGRTYGTGGGTPLAAMFETMATLLDPADRRLKDLDAWFDPYRAPDGMLPYLAAWVDLGWLPTRAETQGEASRRSGCVRWLRRRRAWRPRGGPARACSGFWRSLSTSPTYAWWTPIPKNLFTL